VIAVDSSILAGIIRGERDAQRLLPLLDGDECAIGAAHPGGGPPLVLCERHDACVQLARGFIDGGPTTAVPFSREMADVAAAAFSKFGRASGHPPRLNFGDCLAYAVAAVMRAPLLFGGDVQHRCERRPRIGPVPHQRL
jgi:ribonuclease VapC